MTVRLRVRDYLVRDVCAAARSVLDDDLLAPALRELLGDDAPNHTGWPCRCKGHDDAHNPARPRRGACPNGGDDARNEQGGGRGRIELTARHHHDFSPAAV